MLELQKRNRWRRVAYSLPGVFVLLVLTFFSIRGAYDIFLKERISKKEAELLITKVEDLKARETFLTEKVEDLTTPSGVEEEIKSKFNVARAGEHVALIVEGEEPEATSTPQKSSWWQRFWSGIINDQ